MANPRPEDYIIPIMGPTGAGKSTFINLLLGTERVPVGHSLNSCTRDLGPIDIPAATVQHFIPSWQPRSDTAKLIIVDTPGFDDTSADDSEILKRIADWLTASYGSGAKLAGVIYLQDICQRRVTGATKRNFEVFDKLCGKDACKSIVLGTTQWTRVPPNEREMARAREQELRDNFWRDMVSKGSKMQRVDDKARKVSPWDLVETILLKNRSAVLQIQEELTTLHKSLPQTEAAIVLRGRIDELIQSLKKAGATKEEIDALAKEVKALKEKIAWWRRLWKWT
ncbi:hypothetical protein D9619_000394 [Psilocybe cf. subviscida]|uniref:G domain-containing protein n=1 Tax=Psilocybe cf. subviscida TaxID=2480587 RepID=A0A8H5BCS5_9AGAR|nr:hypothetical protein D9619_000394 [Psilocybe cf. subviscida]